MYKAQIVASAVVHEDNAEGFAEIVKPALSAICSGKLSESTNPNGYYRVFGTVTDPDFSYEGSDEWAKSLAEKIAPYSAVSTSLYLTDEDDGIEYWADLEDGVYVIVVGEDEDPAQIDPSEIIWGQITMVKNKATLLYKRTHPEMTKCHEPLAFKEACDLVDSQGHFDVEYVLEVELEDGLFYCFELTGDHTHWFAYYCYLDSDNRVQVMQEDNLLKIPVDLIPITKIRDITIH